MKRLDPYPDEIVCTRCGNKKPKSEFSRNGIRSDGTARLRRYCIVCYNEYISTYRKDPGAKGKYKAVIAEWRKRHPEKIAMYNRKRRSLASGANRQPE